MREDVRFYFAEVVEFLNAYDQITIHQFAPTVVYLPVYMVIHDLKEKIKIKIQNSGSSDIDTLRNVSQAVNSSIIGKKQDKCLHIGLSEFNPDIADVVDSGFHKFTLIKRVPLWGLALSNNPRINQKRKETKNSSAINDYWEIFGSKFSLLQKDDFKNLTISIYPEGSTIYRLFSKLIKHDLANVVLAPRSIDMGEFDDLFSGIADVCLTVHPTYAIKKASQNRLKLEVVFNYYGEPISFTSIYMRKFSDPEEDSVVEKFMNYLKFLVYEKIELFYKDTAGYASNSEIYCDINKTIAKDNNGDSICATAKMMLANSCIDCKMPTQIAQQILNDSRIYSHEIDWSNDNADSQSLLSTVFSYCLMSAMSKNLDELSEKDLPSLFPCHHKHLTIQLIKDISIGCRDPIMALSQFAANKDNDVKRMRHSDEVKYDGYNSLQGLNDYKNDAIEQALKFGHVCNYCGIRLEGENFQQINQDFKVNKAYIESIFSFCEIEESNIYDNIIYVHKKKLFKEAFNLILANSEDMIKYEIKPKMILNCNIINNELLFIRIILEFAPVGDYDPTRTDFLNKNVIGHKILNGWFIKPSQEPRQHFNIADHGIIIISNDKVMHIFDRSTFEICDYKRDKYYWIFDFKVYKYLDDDRTADVLVSAKNKYSNKKSIG